LTTSPRTAGHHQYELTNHLGNVSVIVSDNKLLSANQSQKLYLPDVLEYQDYYPFGMVMNDRKGSYTNRDYRYGFNGQMKDDEISGEGNHNTAMYWEYNTRLGRRWNQDPKPNTSISKYSAFANNPIWYRDPLGDTIKISYRTGFLGLGKKRTLNYVGGSLFNVDGSAYLGEVKGFIKQTIDALGNISKGAEGESVIDELVGSKNVFIIEKGSKNDFIPKSTSKAGANIPEVQSVTGNTLGSKGTGGKISFNPYSTESGFNTEGNRSRPAYIGLAHELFHSRDANQGVLHFANNFTSLLSGSTYYATQSGLEKSEWRAVYFENVLRGQLGLHLRTHYGVKETSLGVFAPDGPKLLDSSGNPINYQIK
jgi:RHS repeat-associated protein